MNKAAAKDADYPVFLFKQGNNQEAQRFFGAHLCERDGQPGAVFRVWAPHAKAVSVVGDFNSWVPTSHPMTKVEEGIWELFIPGIKEYDVYKYCVTTQWDELVFKADRMRSTQKPGLPTAARCITWTAMSGMTALGWQPRNSRM